MIVPIVQNNTDMEICNIMDFDFGNFCKLSIRNIMPKPMETCRFRNIKVKDFDDLYKLSIRNLRPNLCRLLDQ